MDKIKQNQEKVSRVRKEQLSSLRQASLGRFVMKKREL